MNYRGHYDNIYGILTTILKFFQQSHSDTIRSFMQFMLANLCETLAEEQFKLALIVFKERNFVCQSQFDRFIHELQIVNHLIKFLFHNDFEGQYYPVRIERDIQHKTKKFTEFAQKRIDRITEKLKLNGINIELEYPSERLKK